ncbi:MAG: autotransporter-associated beta strand repeat protein [Chthonomonadaceae bacterium]|nr:autotransporter-associated beta strand repeat protein [Chthonomonadaceae bacterium]
MSPKSLFAAGLLAASSVCFVLPAQADIIAYDVPSGTTSNQFITNPLGLDFDVNGTIHITALGVFDSNQNGLSFATPVYIYDRNTQLPVVSVVIPAGTATTLINGSRFVNLITPITLNAGFQGTVVEDPNTTDGNFNSQGGATATTLNTGGGLLSFVGAGRVSDNGPGTYPARGDGGPNDRYYAATFEYAAGAATPAATPEPGALAWMAGLGITGCGLVLRRRARRK